MSKQAQDEEEHPNEHENEHEEMQDDEPDITHAIWTTTLNRVILPKVWDDSKNAMPFWTLCCVLIAVSCVLFVLCDPDVIFVCAGRVRKDPRRLHVATYVDASTQDKLRSVVWGKYDPQHESALEDYVDTKQTHQSVTREIYRIYPAWARTYAQTLMKVVKSPHNYNFAHGLMTRVWSDHKGKIHSKHILTMLLGVVPVGPEIIIVGDVAESCIGVAKCFDIGKDYDGITVNSLTDVLRKQEHFTYSAFLRHRGWYLHEVFGVQTRRGDGCGICGPVSEHLVSVASVPGEHGAFGQSQHGGTSAS